jgi:hypothetical protein
VCNLVSSTSSALQLVESLTSSRTLLYPKLLTDLNLLPIFLASLFTSSSHLAAGLPTFLLPLGFAFKSHLGVWSPMHCTSLARWSLPIFMTVVNFGSLNNVYSSLLYLRGREPFHVGRPH